jgi:hypothetical protein
MPEKLARTPYEHEPGHTTRRDQHCHADLNHHQDQQPGALPHAETPPTRSHTSPALEFVIVRSSPNCPPSPSFGSAREAQVEGSSPKTGCLPGSSPLVVRKTLTRKRLAAPSSSYLALLVD